MPITTTVFLTLAVTLSTWSSPQPEYSAGHVGLYGPIRLVEANARYRGYSLDGYRCGGSLMSPSDIGKTFWVMLPDGDWYGPCLSVDCSARKDFVDNVYKRQEVAEVDDGVMQALGQRWRAWTNVYIGYCPSGEHYVPQIYSPKLEYDWGDPMALYSHAAEFYPPPEPMGFCKTDKAKSGGGSPVLSGRR